ncbi:MAG: DNA repair protein RecO C-terminal domain-containing protein [Desulfovibrio sp.]|nr:DNA repair protein RecO C-terminal domain-containing protein [Desulfovibrio sp.]
MREWTDVAFVLRTGHFREIDVWLRLLVPGRGLVSCFAFGGAKSRRRFCGCLEVLTTISGRFVERRQEFCTLEEAVRLDGPVALRANVGRMGLAANCIHFVEAVGGDPESSHVLFALLEDLRGTLEKRSVLSNALPLFFRLHVARTLGLAPDFSRCAICGAPMSRELAFFQLDEGLLFCSRCLGKERHERNYQLLLSPRERALLTEIELKLPHDWNDSDCSSEERRRVIKAIDGFIFYHMGIVWENGTFRKSRP